METPGNHQVNAKNQNIATDMKDIFSGLVNGLGTAKKRSSEPEDRSTEISWKENSKGRKQMGGKKKTR